MRFYAVPQEPRPKLQPRVGTGFTWCERGRLPPTQCDVRRKVDRAGEERRSATRHAAPSGVRKAQRRRRGVLAAETSPFRRGMNDSQLYLNWEYSFRRIQNFEFESKVHILTNNSLVLVFVSSIGFLLKAMFQKYFIISDAPIHQFCSLLTL